MDSNAPLPVVILVFVGLWNELSLADKDTVDHCKGQTIIFNNKNLFIIKSIQKWLMIINRGFNWVSCDSLGPLIAS